jgi:hypothetical protein
MSNDWWQKPLKFPEREIFRYAEHVSSADLKVGQVYFRLSYLDEGMEVPELAPLVFIGRDLDPPNDESHQLYFQDATSYLAGVRWEDPTPEITGEPEEERFESWLQRGHFELFNESAGASVCEFEKALDLLLLCSLRRRGLDREAPSNSG